MPIPVNTSLKFLCIFFVNFVLASLSASLFVLDLKLIWHVCTVIDDAHTAGVDYVCSLLWGARYLARMWVPSSAYLSLVKHFTLIFSNPNSFISGIPNSARPSPGTTMNLHLRMLCQNQTEQIPTCFMFELMCVLGLLSYFLLCIMSLWLI